MCTTTLFLVPIRYFYQNIFLQNMRDISQEFLGQNQKKGHIDPNKEQFGQCCIFCKVGFYWCLMFELEIFKIAITWTKNNCFLKKFGLFSKKKGHVFPSNRLLWRNNPSARVRWKINGVWCGFLAISFLNTSCYKFIFWKYCKMFQRIQNKFSSTWTLRFSKLKFDFFS